MEDPRLCVVGAGNHATRRIYPYLGAAGAQLVGVCDLDREKAERNARRFGGTPYDALEPMLEAEQPDGVMVCIGPSAHAELAPIVMRRGIPVYTEKPPAATAAAALAVARVSLETGVLCTTAFKKRYATAIAQRAPGGPGSGLAHSRPRICTPSPSTTRRLPWRTTATAPPFCSTSRSTGST